MRICFVCFIIHPTDFRYICDGPPLASESESITNNKLQVIAGQEEKIKGGGGEKKHNPTGDAVRFSSKMLHIPHPE